jgi:speckle-type POZ protein
MLSRWDVGRSVQSYTSESFRGSGWGFSIVKRSDLEPLYAANGWVTIMCGVIVVSNDPKPVPSPPPSDIGLHLSQLLDRSMETDVTFMVGGEAFPAHRAVLAARSPVFETQLLGSMADATMPSMSITVRCRTSTRRRSELCFGSCTRTPGLQTQS